MQIPCYLKIIYRSAIRPRTLKTPNQRLIDAGGEEDYQPHSKTLKHPTSSSDVDKPTQPDIPSDFIKSRHNSGPTPSKPLPEFNPDDLVGRTFLLLPEANGERLRAKVTSKNNRSLRFGGSHPVEVGVGWIITP